MGGRRYAEGMMLRRLGLSLLSMFLMPLAFAQKADVRLSDISTTEDSSIVIRKGRDSGVGGPDYEIVAGTDDISGDPENERKAAYANWKRACTEWRASMKELNRENQILTLNCNQPKMKKEDYFITYQSLGSYKLRVRVREHK